MATAKDIAQIAGVSLSAVSIALNGKPGISDETRRRILEIADDLGYRKRPWNEQRDSFFQLLIYVRSDETINVSTNPFFMEIVEGVSTRARELNYSLQISYVQEAELEQIPLSRFISPKCGGVLILATNMSTAFADQIRQLALPTVVLDNAFPRAKLDCVTIDNGYAISSIMDYLCSLGHKDFCFVSRDSYMVNMQERAAAFRSYLQDHPELECSLAEPVLGFKKPEGISLADEMQSVFGCMKKLPTAVVCVNDWFASACVRALTALGYRIPQDVSVTGFDNIPLGEMLSPSVTTIDIPKNEIGVLAVNRLAELIAGSATPVKTQVSSSIVIRESTAAPNR